jgi:hypothetical protein
MIVTVYLLSVPSSKLTIHAEQQRIRITVNRGQSSPKSESVVGLRKGMAEWDFTDVVERQWMKMRAISTNPRV